MTTITAVYEKGLLRPLQPLTLTENQLVHLNIEPAPSKFPEWILRLREVREKIGAGKPFFPDSALEVAEDRQR